MNRLIQVGLLFVSLMVGIQGQEPSISLSLLPSPSPSPPPSAKPRSCKINLDLRVSEMGPDNIWDGWFFVSISPELEVGCGELRTDICTYVSNKSQLGCDTTWDRKGTCTGPETQGRYRGGVICARGEQCIAGAPYDHQYLVDLGIKLIGEYLDLLATRVEWKGDAREWDEVPCFRFPHWLTDSGKVALIVLGSLFGTLIISLIMHWLGCFPTQCCIDCFSCKYCNEWRGCRMKRCCS